MEEGGQQRARGAVSLSSRRGGPQRGSRGGGHGDGSGMAPVPVRHSEEERGRGGRQGGPLSGFLNLFLFPFLTLNTAGFIYLIKLLKQFQKIWENSGGLPMS